MSQSRAGTRTVKPASVESQKLHDLSRHYRQIGIAAVAAATSACQNGNACENKARTPQFKAFLPEDLPQQR